MSDALDLCERRPALFDAGVALAMGLIGKGSAGADGDGDDLSAPTRRRPGENAGDYARRLKEKREANAERIRNKRGRVFRRPADR